MALRAFVVLLLILNVGVALWWLMRAPPPMPDAMHDTRGVPRLQLRGEAAEPPVPAPQPVAATYQAPEAASEQVPEQADTVVGREAQSSPQCLTIGPFDAAATRDALAARIASDAGASPRVRMQEHAPRGWRVMLPPQADRAAARAAAARLVEAGFDDHFVVESGADANAVALGRFGSEPAARRHAAALQAAGFSVQAQPVGGGAEYWIDLSLAPDQSLAAIQALAGAVAATPVTCAEVAAGSR